MMNPDKFPDPASEKASKVEIELLEARIMEGVNKVESRFSNEDPEIVEIAKALVTKQAFHDASDAFNKQLAELSSKSEALIDSPNANTPEVRAERKIIADNINVVWVGS